MSFLILVSISNYTAQVTLNNIIAQQSGAIKSLEDGINRGYRFCGWASLKDPIERAYPKLAGLYIGMGDGKSVFQGMDTGVCDAAIIDDVAWEVALSGDYSQAEDSSLYANHPTGAPRYHCDTKMKLEQAVYSIEIALPLRSDLQRLMSWLLTKEKANGEWARADVSARQRLMRPSVCTLKVSVLCDRSVASTAPPFVAKRCVTVPCAPHVLSNRRFASQTCRSTSRPEQESSSFP